MEVEEAGRMRLEIELAVPEEALGPEMREAPTTACREEAVLRLLAERKIPGAMATRLLGVGRLEFLEMARARGIGTFDYTYEDWKADGAALEEYDRRTHG